MFLKRGRCIFFVFFFSSRRRHTRSTRDWSSDVCSSDLIYRATGILHSVDRLDAAEADDSLRDFLQERWKGVWPILYGDQLRQARLDDWIFQGLLDVEHLPA